MKPVEERRTVVFDLDGTLANVSHRTHLVRGPRKHRDYTKFFKECVNDTMNAEICDMAYIMHEMGYDVIIVSARSKEVETETKEWLVKYNIPCTELYLVRAKGDTTRDTVLKRNWLNSCGFKDDILFVVDDRGSVVRMWREEGLTCLQTSNWEEKENESKRIEREKRKAGHHTNRT